MIRKEKERYKNWTIIPEVSIICKLEMIAYIFYVLKNIKSARINKQIQQVVRHKPDIPKPPVCLISSRKTLSKILEAIPFILN